MSGREILLFNKIVSIIAGYVTVVCSDSIKLTIPKYPPILEKLLITK